MTRFSLYVHLPYCVHKCPYCDFNSYGLERKYLGDLEAEYSAALLSEMAAYARQPAWNGRQLQSIFFGGGTPSLFQPSSIAQILTQADTLFGIESDTEVTLEANPGTVQEELGLEKLRGFRSVGINRLSFGVQSLFPEKLKKLGRIHSTEDSTAAYDIARKAGFENVNLDLMYGTADEQLSDLEVEIQQICDLHPEHISAYCLTIEPGTEFGRLARKGALLQVNDDTQADMYLLVHERLADRGYEQYEVSNFSRPGLTCRHNRAYWEGDDYLGLGAGAHSYLGGQSPFGRRWSNIPGPSDYIQRIESSSSAAHLQEELTQEQAVTEYFFLRLRQTTGASLKEFESRFSRPATKKRGEFISQLVQSGRATYDGDVLRLTPSGLLLLNSIVPELSQL